MGNAWIIVSAPDEATANPDSVWSGSEFLPIADINQADTYTDTTFTVVQVRAFQGDLQSRYTDRDVRMRRATVTVTLV